MNHIFTESEAISFWNENHKTEDSIEHFHDKQWQCIDSILNRNDVLCIMPTGFGKSICFQLPALAFSGITIVISPLKSLIKDQVDYMQSKDVIRALSINGSMTLEEKNHALKLATTPNSNVKMIYITPELLKGAERGRINPILKELSSTRKISMVVIDEAHCVSLWGCSFRPAYRIIKHFVRHIASLQNQKPIVAAFTATAATTKLQNDIIQLLGLSVTSKPGTPGHFSEDHLIISDSKRENLIKEVKIYKSDIGKIRALDNYIKKYKNEKGIIFCPTIDEVYEIYDRIAYMFPNKNDLQIFHGKLPEEYKNKAQENFIKPITDYSQVTGKWIISTSAFGMGVNIKDIRHVLNYSMPLSLEDYEQQCGRAGRDGKKSYCLLLTSIDDLKQKINWISHPNIQYPIYINEFLLKPGEYLRLCQMATYCEKKATPTKETRKSWTTLINKMQFLLNLSEQNTASYESYKDIPKQDFVFDILANGQPFTIYNASPMCKRLIQDGELSYFDKIISDGVFSLWLNNYAYNNSFSITDLFGIITGDIDKKTKNITAQQKQNISNSLDILIQKEYLPITKSKSGRKYSFLDITNDFYPWNFPLQEDNSYLTTLQLKQLYELGRNPQISETKNNIMLKQYLLWRVNGINLAYNTSFTRASKRLSNKIIYSRIDHATGKPTGLLETIGLTKETYKRNYYKNRDLLIVHNTITKILDNMIRIKLIHDYSIEVNENVSQDTRNGEPVIGENGEKIRGIEIISYSPD